MSPSTAYIKREAITPRGRLRCSLRSPPKTIRQPALHFPWGGRWTRCSKATAPVCRAAGIRIPSRRRSRRTAIPSDTLTRYITHTLFPTQTKGEAAVKPKSVVACTCPYAEEIKRITAEKIRNERIARAKLFCEWAKQGGRPDGWERPYGSEVVLKHSHGPAASPFWVVKTKAPIIHDHNQFYTPLFMNFLRGLYDDVLSGQTFAFEACKDSASEKEVSRATETPAC